MADPGPAGRVLSLVPSVTETLAAWGVEVVACTRFCEQPHLVHVGGTKNPDLAAIRALAPDLVVLDREENRREDYEALVAAGISCHVTAVHDVGGLGEELRALASAVGVAEPPAWQPPPIPPVTLRAFVPIWRRPWMSVSADTYGGSLLRCCGVELTTGRARERYPVVELDDVRAAGPDVVLLPSEPYTFTAAHEAELAGALGNVPIVRVDGQDLFWWGVRTPLAYERLRATVTAIRRDPRPAGP